MASPRWRSALHFAATRNPSVIDWTFPPTLQEVWNNLDPLRRNEIALDCASSPDRRNLLPLTMRHLANSLSTRSQTITAQREQEFAANLVTYIHTDAEALDELFRVYFSLRHKKMMAAFLDHMQVRPDIGSSQEPRSDFEKAITALLRDFPKDDVALYTQVLCCQNPAFWGELPKVNAQAADAGRRNRTPQTSPAPRPLTPRYAPAAEFLKSEEPTVPETSTAPEQPRDAQELHADLREVSDLFARTADELAAAAAELREGKLPSADGKSIGSLAPAFARLVGRVRASAEARGVASEQAFYSVRDVEPVVAAIEAAEKAQADAQRIAQLLEQVLSLATTDGRDFPPLTSLKESARALQQQFASAKPNSADPALRDKLHGFELVLQMVDSQSGQDEDAEEVVATQFGAKLLFALGTGRIVRSLSPETDVRVPVLASLPAEPQSAVALPLQSPDLADEIKAAFQS